MCVLAEAFMFGCLGRGGGVVRDGSGGRVEGPCWRRCAPRCLLLGKGEGLGRRGTGRGEGGGRCRLRCALPSCK